MKKKTKLNKSLIDYKKELEKIGFFDYLGYSPIYEIKLKREKKIMNMKKIIDWYSYTTKIKGVGINNEQSSWLEQYEPIFEGETKEEAIKRVKKEITK